MATISTYAPLTDPVTAADVAAFKASVKAQTSYASVWNLSLILVPIFFVVVSGVMGIGFLGAFGGTIASAFNGGPPANLSFVIVPVLFLVGPVAVAVVLLRRVGGTRWEQWYRLDRFASANGMIFSPRDSDQTYPGAIFLNGSGRQTLDHLRSSSGRFLDYGNYRYVTGSGKNQSTHTWGFLAFQLDRSLPHMVLDSRANNGLFGATNLPAAFKKDQILSLEGDFNKHFTLYCPQAYERDALYVFTPDLMALLIDNAAPFDVEIVDKWMFVYSAKPFTMTQPAVHHRLMSIVDTVGSKTLTQTDRYSDDRIQNFSANIVASQGQRLKRRIPVAVIIVVTVTVFGFVVFPMINTLVGALGQ